MWTMKVKFAQLCPTLFDSMDCHLPGSSVHGILQARILEWAAMPFSSRSFWLRDQLWENLKIWGDCSTLSYRNTLVKTSIHPSMAFTTQSCNKPNKAVQCNKHIEGLWHAWFRTSSLYPGEAGSNPCSSTYCGRGSQPPSQGLVPFTRSAAALD